MSTRFPREMFGVQIIYIRDHVARKVTSIVPGGRGVWVLLPDGRVGTNDAELFKWAWPKGSQKEVTVAEKLWRLGKMSRSKYQQLAATFNKKKQREHMSYAAGNVKDYAREIGLKFTKEQQAAIDKLTS